MTRIALAVLLAVVGLPPALAAPVTPQPGPAALGVEWSMPDRFGADADGNGRIDFPNTTAYVHNRASGCAPCPLPSFAVHLEAVGPATAAIAAYTWTITAATLPQPIVAESAAPSLEVALPEGDYSVAVVGEVPLLFTAVRIRGGGAITVEDLLVVAIGDSYASGEGNPEMRRGPGSATPLWGDGGDDAATIAHAAAHRSTVAWPARTALVLEANDHRSSVTFVSVATTSARIDWGILSPQGDQGASQLDQLAALVGDRRIDLLLVQEGGNSIGFARLVRALVEADPLFDPICYHLLVDQALASAADGDWTRDTSVSFRLPFDWSCEPTRRASGAHLPGLDGLSAAFERLDLGLRRFEIGQVVLVGYPDPTGAGNDGERCREIVGDVTPPLRFHEISGDEGRRGVSDVLVPLNSAIEAAAQEQGWWFVGGIASSFAAGHGYCAPWPDYGYPADFAAIPGFAASTLDHPDGWYRNPGANPWPPALGSADVTWYRNAAQSVVLQGPEARFATSGTLHPNEVGHAAIALLVMQRLQSGGFW
ncbi:MAG TPA: hypothetical protein DCY40_00700 [Actinobacteria bacterium]|nr:hypothetical protein [Actinomycetota bacterium]